jgi:hypothetical protein
MLLRMFTVFDSKAEAFLPPFYLAAVGQAIRHFSDTASDPQHAFGRHPDDYTLFQIGTFDDQHASFDILESKISLGTALELLNPDRLPSEPPLLKEMKAG